MTSATIDHAKLGKQVDETTAPKHGDLHQDVEVGAEATDIARIEKVYA